MVGISLFVPLFLAYPLYVDLSPDMSFEDSDANEDLSTCQKELKIFVPAVSSNPLLPEAHFRNRFGIFWSPLASYTQIAPVLRC